MYIYVIDCGMGIEEENISHVFERFTSSYRQKDNSSGLGLAITKKVAEAHFGEVYVKNNEDKGVTFTVFLPNMQGKGAYRVIESKEQTE